MQETPDFSHFKLNKQILTAVEEAGYTKPTEIQERAIPLMLAGQDLFGIAPTGTGKTAAYVLPLLMKLKYAQGDHPRALILAPTRELVLQIEGVVKQMGKYTDLRSIALIGGKGIKPQAEAVAAGMDILIATPGRFWDVYATGALLPRFIKTMVMDEADKMLDMGFRHQINKILEVVPPKRQNALFSATMGERVTELAGNFLDFPERIEIAPQATTADTIDQYIYETPNLRTKLNLLLHLLQDRERFVRAIVFTKTRQTASDIAKYLERKLMVPVRVVHANKDQNARNNAMDAFREGDVPLLVTTDIASRGLDITDVSHVINFDVPLIYEDYVHRVGRTGRAEKTGEAITFVTPSELYHFTRIEELIRRPIPRLEVPEEMIEAKTPFEEQQDMAREIDRQKRKENPDFKGAFHEKKSPPHPQDPTEQKRLIKKGKRRKGGPSWRGR
ncbi:DEAD/DEAH box helicase [Cesiribacter andamanensis]|uniref:ATP-dependent RNA helicase rhlE n=1 Tax=Cesiribacter andamanensis AMV16 TaxID=1279009 RepID=M7NV49_9BACT|nr:DEAD/DEAH box helicase [Cesiribacter andamanensis]EMR02329.1 ATP-dependent RNA helicase rhlE [Cesiribacter andamanensis AMV16]